MHFKEIRLVNFKNFRENTFSLEGDLVAITGANGTGKTNLIDSIHFSCLCKSYFHSSDKFLFRHGEPFYSVRSVIEDEEGRHELFIRQKEEERKKISLDGSEYERISDHIGTFPVVMIAPSDTDLVRGGSELRRRLLDMLLSQSDKNYLTALQKYKGLQRNKSALLKAGRQNRSVDSDLLAVYNEQMTPLMNFIFSVRAAFVEHANAEISTFYSEISGNSEKADLRLDSELNGENAHDLLQSNMRAELESGRSLCGPQKDDLDFALNNRSIKRYGSQGQQKSFLIALKLMQFNYLLDTLFKAPVLLLDDIFEKLDGNRLASLFELVMQPPFDQVFITDTSSERVQATLGGSNLAEIKL